MSGSIKVMPMERTAARRLGQYIATLGWEDMPNSTQDRVRRLLVWNLLVAVAGVEGAVLPKPLKDETGFAVLSNGYTHNRDKAIAFNAAAIHARTQDDFSKSHAGGHIGACVLPAVLAVVPEVRPAGNLFWEAVVAGYVAQVAIARVSSRETMSRGFRSVGLYGPFGAAAAVSKLRSFEPEGIANSISLAASTAAGLGQCWVDGSDEWQLQPGLAAIDGLRSAELTSFGIRGADHALEGSAGFFSAYAGLSVEKQDPFADLNASSVIDDIAVKQYPVSGICQPVVRLFESISREIGKKTGAVRSIDIFMHPEEAEYPGTSSSGPFVSATDALMSAPFCAACVLATGKLSFDDLGDLQDVTKNRIASRVRVVQDNTRAFLEPKAQVHMMDGSVVEDEISASLQAATRSDETAWLHEIVVSSGISLDYYSNLRAAIYGLDTPADVEKLISHVASSAVQRSPAPG